MDGWYDPDRDKRGVGMSTILVIIYVLGAIFTYGFTKGIILKTFSDVLGWHWFDEMFALGVAIVWPIGLPEIALLSYFHENRTTIYWCIRFRK